jgi:dCTP diphosphatase
LDRRLAPAILDAAGRGTTNSTTQAGVAMSADEHDFDTLVDAVRQFRDDRDWERFHNAKDLAVSISIEAAELLERFQWKDADAVNALIADPTTREGVADEMADVLLLLVSLGEATGIDLLPAAFRKLRSNAEKYPIEKARGRADKYDQL